VTYSALLNYSSSTLNTMTKLAILSDIHGNLPALEAVLADLKNFEIDQVIIPGDVINFGPFPNETAEIVIQNRWPVLRGNNEYFLLDFNTSRAPAEWNDPVQFAPTAWLAKTFDPKLKSHIQYWPDTLHPRFPDAPPILVCHGTPSSAWDSIYHTMSDDEIDKILMDTEAEFVICGHTHLPMDRQVYRRRIFNPGSVGIPLDGLFSASYMILEGDSNGWNPTFRRVPFDRERVMDGFKTSGFNKNSGLIGRLVLEVHRTARPQFGFLKWHKFYKPNLPLSNELIDEYLAEGKWWEFADSAYHINF
jgi:predicted phosphodiesterase